MTKNLLWTCLVALCLLLTAQSSLAQAPAITSFTPTSGTVGKLVTITGTNLGTPTAFTIGGTSALVISNTGTSLVGMVMPGALTGPVSLSNASGTAISTDNFIVTATPAPTIQQGSKLVGTGNTGTSNQGSAVSISADGNTAVVGGSADNSNQGAAWVYTRSNGTWSQQGNKLVGTGGVSIPTQGISVAINADGNTILVGGSADNTNQGAVWVFTRTGGVWTQQGNKLLGTGNTGIARQGISVALSADGNTALVGGYGDNSNLGAAWVFTRSAGTWTQQGNKLVGTGSIGAARQGFAVALSADGNTALVGGRFDDTNKGAFWIFVRNGGTWTQQGGKMVGTGGVGLSNQGAAVALSADGNTAMIGAFNDNTVQGAAWVFTRTDGLWAQEGNKLISTGNTGAARQAYSVSLSADGNTALIGGYSDNVNVGAVWLWKRSGGTWSQRGDKLVGSGTTGGSLHGYSASLSADGTTSFVGGMADNSSVGAAWAYYVSTNANLTSLTSTAGALTLVPASLSSYTASVLHQVSSVTVSTSAADANANLLVRVNGGSFMSLVSAAPSSALNLNVGDNSIEVKVIAEDGTTTKNYALTVTRAASSDATLSSLASSTGTISPTFTAGTSAYTVSVGNSTASITITPAVAEGTATVTINAVTVASGAASGSIPLNLGDNIITTLVTAGNGTTTKTYTITVTRAGSADATLSNMVVSAGTLSPVFSAGTISYSAAVPHATTSITLTPTAAEGTAVIKVNAVALASGAASGSIPLTVGINTITTIVTAGDGTTTKSYTLTITRAVSSDATLSSLALSAGTISPPFTAGTSAYTVSVGNSTTSITLTPTVTEGTATVKVNSVSVASGAASGSIPLNVGVNTITTIVTAGDGTTTKSYTLTVTRAASSDATLSSFATSTGTISPTFTAETSAYTASVGNATASIILTPTVTEGTATVKVNSVSVASGAVSGSIPLNVGVNTITTIVTAGDGTTTKTYTLTITRRELFFANLAALTTTAGALSPVFSPASTAYTIAVPFSKNTIKPTPTVEEAGATVTVNGAAVGSTLSSGEISLNVGTTVITIVVTAPDGSVTKSYTLMVTRMAVASLADLSALTTSAGTLSPIFSPSTTKYTLFVTNSVSTTVVTSTADNEFASVKVNGTAVGSAIPSGAINLAEGTNSITVLVTAENGSTKAYTIEITRVRADQTLTDENGIATVNDSVKEVIVTSGASAITVNVSAGTTANTTIDYGYLLSVGATIPKTTINSDLGIIEIPAAAVTTSTPVWDGVIDLPKISAYTTPDVKGMIFTVGLVFEVGSPNNPLSFDKGIRVVLPGQAGMRVAGVNNGIFTEITTTGTTDTQAEGDALSSGSSVKISAGADLIVWTKTLSKFVTFSERVNLDDAIVAADLAELTPSKIIGSNPGLNSISSPLTLPATGSGGSTITWFSGNEGLVSDDGKIINRPALGTGNATVTITAIVSKGTSSEPLTFTLTILEAPNSVPTLNPIASKAICYTLFAQNIALSGISAGSETGQTTTLAVAANKPEMFSMLSINNGVLNYTLNPGVSGVADITITVKDNGGTANGGNDTFSRSFTLTVNELPATPIMINVDGAINKHLTAILTASGGVTYSWAAASGIISGQNTATLKVSPAATTTYSVTITNATGCSSVQSVTLSVVPEVNGVIANNIMTPNGDGKNDLFIIQNMDMYPDNILKIFDRSGRLVYQMRNYTNDWDAKFNGSPLAEDAYFYVLEFGADRKQLKGFISVVR